MPRRRDIDDLTSEPCPRCHRNKALEPHACPFQEEVNDDMDEEYCVCCRACARKCKEEIPL